MTYEVKFPDDSFVLEDSSGIIYGDSGIGKTTIACTMPNPLFVFMRGGGEHRPLPLIGKKIPYIEIFTKAQLDEFMLEASKNGLPRLDYIKKALTMEEAIAVSENGVMEKYEPKTLVTDQMTSMYSLLLDNVVKTVARKRFLADHPEMADYGTAHKQFLNYMYTINQIPGVHKIYLALSELDEDELTKERYGGPMVPGKMAREVLKFTDFVFRMHVRREMRDNKLYEYRAFLTQPEGTWLAKDSSGKLPKVIELPSPDYDFWNNVIVKSILGK